MIFLDFIYIRRLLIQTDLDLNIKPTRKIQRIVMKYSVKEILHLEVSPALGCTEPVAIALATAAAASVMPDKRRIKSKSGLTRIFIRMGWP